MFNSLYTRLCSLHTLTGGELPPEIRLVSRWSSLCHIRYFWISKSNTTMNLLLSWSLLPNNLHLQNCITSKAFKLPKRSTVGENHLKKVSFFNWSSLIPKIVTVCHHPSLTLVKKSLCSFWKCFLSWDATVQSTQLHDDSLKAEKHLLKE